MMHFFPEPFEGNLRNKKIPYQGKRHLYLVLDNSPLMKWQIAPNRISSAN